MFFIKVVWRRKVSTKFDKPTPPVFAEAIPIAIGTGSVLPEAKIIKCAAYVIIEAGVVPIQYRERKYAAQRQWSDIMD